MKKLQLLAFGFISTIILLFLYSYTQVDLGLTLSRVSIWQGIQKSFQYIGYFQRPLSTTFYIIILVLLYSFYSFFLYFSHKNLLKKDFIWKIIFIMSAILLFTYSAFSYDIFNYMFDARIITHYFQNPYLHSALDFPGDPMLSFMHWTQRTYPYGPFWLVLTVPLSFIGMQFFLITFFLFKALGVASYLITVYFLEKILEKINPKHAIFGIVLFAFNPLVIIESLISAHLDIVMMAFAAGSLYHLMINKNVRSITLFILSVCVKFATAFLIPVFLFVFYSKKMKKKISWEIVFILSSILMITAVFFESVRTNFQPWYPLIVYPLLILIGKKDYVIVLIIFSSLLFLFEYIPFLYTGNWNPPIPTILQVLTITGVVVSLLIVSLIRILKPVLSKK